MLWVGLTGGIATGKSTVSRYLRANGFAVVDADVLAREVAQNGTPAHHEIIQAFGPGAVSADGALDRKKIGSIVFKDRAQLRILESILHPRIRELANAKRRELEAAGAKIAFYDVPLLFEKNMEPIFDLIAVVACSPERQLEHLMKRNGLSRIEAERRIGAQLPIAEKVARADFVLLNEGTITSLEADVDVLIEKLRAHQAKT